MNASYALKVPVSLPNKKAAPTKAEKARRRAEKRRIMARREMMKAEYLRQHTDTWNMVMTAFCQKRFNDYCYFTTAQRVTFNRPEAVRGSDGYLYLPAQTVVPAGRTAEQIHESACNEADYLWNQGWSWVHEACNCHGCRTQRRAQYEYLTLPGNRPEERTKQSLTAWDRGNNPFSPLYGLAQRSGRRQRDRGVARGAGCSGATYSDSTAKGDASRLIGVEIEHNRCVNVDTWRRDWDGADYIGDGSCGYEAVTPPLAGKHIAPCIKQIMACLNEQEAGCDRRCGLHVHVDARDVHWAEMLRILTVYTRLEPLLYLLGGQYRLQGSRYCKAVSGLYAKALRQADPKGAVLSAAVLSEGEDYLPNPSEGRKTMRQTPDKKHGGRYKSLNIMPWIAGRAYDRPDTTIEFRLHRGTLNAERVIRWVSICQDIVGWCVRKDNSDVEKLPKSAARALAIISPRNADWIVQRLLGYRKATTAGGTERDDDVGNIIPKRLVSVIGGMYTIKRDLVNSDD